MKRATRKLTAVLSADVAGYSRLMAADEMRTIATLKKSREVVQEAVARYNGRVVDAPGDNILAAFASTVDAVECAVEIQDRLEGMNTELALDQRMQFRIGINLGDVISDDALIYGDGINITARIQTLAEPGGICVAGSVYDQVRNKLDLDYVNMGERALKNIAEPVRVYRIRCRTPMQGHMTTAQNETAHKPSIIVLPFVNMSGDAEQEYFSDGLTEDLITDLSKLSNLFVIARNSAFTYKGRAVRVQDVGREMGVHYVLEGSVRKAGGRVRITAQLVDALSGGHVWADRYDRGMEDIFAVQDEVTRKIVTALSVKMETGDQELLFERDTDNIDAYDCFLRGMEFFHRYSRESNLKARQMFVRAVELDDRYTAAYVRCGWTYLTEWMLGWTADRSVLDQAFDLAQKAFSTGRTNELGYCLLANAYLWNKEHDKALALYEKYKRLEIDSAEILADFANILNWSGRPQAAIGLAQKAIRLDPLSPAHNLFNLGHAYYLTDDYPSAVRVLREALAYNPDFFPPRIYLTVIYLSLGRKEEAHQEFADFHQKTQFDLAAWRERLPYRDPSITEHMLSAFQKAGLD